MPYNKEELEITDAIANKQFESVPFDNDTIKSDAKHTLEYLKQKKLIIIKKHALDILNSAPDVEPCASDKNITKLMGSTELAANLFRATQAEEKLKKDGVKDKYSANKTHYIVGQKVRQTIEELGGTMPEELDVPQKSITKIEKEQKKLENEEDR